MKCPDDQHKYRLCAVWLYVSKILESSNWNIRTEKTWLIRKAKMGVEIGWEFITAQRKDWSWYACSFSALLFYKHLHMSRLSELQTCYVCKIKDLVATRGHSMACTRKDIHRASQMWKRSVPDSDVNHTDVLWTAISWAANGTTLCFIHDLISLHFTTLKVQMYVHSMYRKAIICKNR